jgi:hypothetical protein
MMLLRSRILIPVVALATLGTSALAHAKQTASIAVHHAWARETAAGQSVGGGFMTITNRTPAWDRLLTGNSPVAAEVQLHTMTMDGGVMRMRQVEDGISIPANGTLELKPGSYHIMFMGLKRQLRQGERFPVTLRFQRAGNVTVQVSVQSVMSSGPMDSGHAGH